MSEITYTCSDRFVLMWPYATTTPEGEKKTHLQFITTGPMENYMECIGKYLSNEISQDLQSLSRKPPFYRLRAYQVKEGENFDLATSLLIFDSSNYDHLTQLKLGHHVAQGDPMASPGNRNCRDGHENMNRIETSALGRSFTILFE
jgi:hypothetical protein